MDGIPQYAQRDFAREWVEARAAAQRTHFPHCCDRRSRRVRAQAPTSGPTHHHKPAVRQAGGER